MILYVGEGEGGRERERGMEGERERNGGRESIMACSCYLGGISLQLLTKSVQAIFWRPY